MVKAFAKIPSFLVLWLSLSGNLFASNVSENALEDMEWKVSIRLMEPTKLFWGKKGDWVEKDPQETLNDPILGQSLKDFIDKAFRGVESDPPYIKNLVVKKGGQEVFYHSGSAMKSFEGVSYANHLLEHLRYLIDLMGVQNSLPSIEWHALGLLFETFELKMAKGILDEYRFNGILPKFSKPFQLPAHHLKAFQKIKDANPDPTKQFQVHLNRAKNGYRLDQEYVLKKMREESDENNPQKVSQLAILFALVYQLNAFDPAGN